MTIRLHVTVAILGVLMSIAAAGHADQRLAWPAQNERGGGDPSRPTWLLKVAPSSPVPPRYAHAMAYDSIRERTVLFGGVDAAHAGDEPSGLCGARHGLRQCTRPYRAVRLWRILFQHLGVGWELGRAPARGKPPGL